jgi:lipid II:glycine glycyltransferase (peptidoglycan interpeptide bridge formation enzyme)
MERIEIKIFENKNLWNKFLDDEGYISFLQDFEYGEIEKNLGREVIRLGIFRDSDLIGVCQMIGYKRKLSYGLVIHHGPVIKKDFFKEGFKKVLEFLEKNGFKKKYHFLRVNPALIYEEDYIDFFKSLGGKLAPTYAVSENFWIKEIKSDEEMLNEMDKTHKKLVIESLKKPYLEIEKTENLDKFDIFWSLYEDLYLRKKFKPYSREFILEEFKLFSKEGKALLFLGKIENKYFSSALVIFSHQSSFYHHAASLPIKEPLNYKIQWEIIQETKRRNLKYYNFWGIARKEEKKHPWYGLTLFKKGFGGKRIDLLPTFDFIFSKRYYLLWLYEKIKRGKL